MREFGNLIFEVNEERVNDRDGVRAVNIAAFSRKEEADLVDQLRDSCSEFISLVAKVDEKVIGHVLFTPVRLIQDQNWSIKGMGLAPLAVSPEYQNQGVGTELCRQGLLLVSAKGYPFVVVLGDPSYYHRFGFESASDFGIRSSFENVPEDAFMIKFLKPGTMSDAKGIVYYLEEFDNVT